MRMVEFAMMLLVRILLLASTLEARLYSIPEGWRVFMNESLAEFQGDGRSGSYRLVSALQERQELVLSSNEDFGLAFLNFNGTKKYYLALMFGTRNSSTAAPVWIANRNAPVTENSMLTREHGRLKLVDANGSVAWSPDNSVAYIGIEDSGNFKIYNESKINVWSSFDHPGSTILPNQKLVTGQTMVSNTDASDPSEGPFVSEIQASGGVVYMSVPSKKKQPYALWGFAGSKLSSPSANCPGYQTAIAFTPAGEVTMTYEPTGEGDGNDQTCGSPLNSKIFPGNTTMRYFQLADDGSMVSYRRESSNGTWHRDNADQILPPAPCGSYGLLENGKQCECLSNGTNNSTMPAPGLRCSKPKWSSLQNCSIKYETDFVELAGASYFTNNFNDPARTGIAVKDCLQECRSTCSCAAIFFDGALQNCWYVEDVLGSLTVDSSKSNLVGFLKYQNYSRLVPAGKSSSKHQKLIAIGVSSGGAVVSVAAFALVFAILHQRNVMLKELNRFLTGVEASPYRFSYSSLSSATGGFTKLLGRGGGGAVYEGKLHNGMKLAVKKLNSEHAQKHFVTEVSALGSISHINIVKLYGFCADASHRLLVYEFMSNGSLDEWIFSSPTTTLDWKTRYSIALDTARGLAYLHDNANDSIIHLDIKPQNILLGDKFEAKVGDFGMAKLLMDQDRDKGSDGVVTAVRGTPGYLAPEWLMHSLATKKCDVYSYGMVLLELIGGRKNLDCSKIDSPLSWYFPAWAMGEIQKGNTMGVIDPSIRDTADTAQARNLIHVAFWCTQEDPGARPSMASVVRMLESMEEIAVPPLTFQFDVQAPGILSIASSGGVATFTYNE